MLLTPHGEWVPVVQGSSGLHAGAFPLLVVKVGGTCVGTSSGCLGCAQLPCSPLVWAGLEELWCWEMIHPCPSLSMATIGEILGTMSASRVRQVLGFYTLEPRV